MVDIFERRGQGKIEKMVIDLEKLYNIHIWQKSELIKHQHMQTELRDQKIIQVLKEAFNMDYVKELHREYLSSFQSVTDETNRSLKLLTDRMQITSSDLKRTLIDLEEKRDALRAEKSLRHNMEAFVEASKTLQEGLEHFDSSMERNLEKIDYELANAVDRLARMTEYIFLQSEKMKREALFDGGSKG